MKKVAILAFFVLLFISCGQEDDYAFKNIPSVVASTFQTNYPHAKDLEWEKKTRKF